MQTLQQPRPYHNRIMIKRAPDKRASDMEITLSIPWDIAHRMAEIAAPFLGHISEAVDGRTIAELEEQQKHHYMNLEHRERDRRAKVKVIRAVRAVYRSGIPYEEFCRMTDFFHSGFRQRDRHQLYHDCRARICARMMKDDRTHADIAEFFGITVSAVSGIQKRIKKQPR